MPTVYCPICESVIDGHVENESQWYAKHAPGMSVGAIVSIICYDCEAELHVGDNVFDRKSGEQGLLVSITCDASGCKTYEVHFAGGATRSCARGQMTLREQQQFVSPDEAAVAKDGYF